MGTQPQVETEFNQIQFEKRLTSLKDSQENINSCCQWCLENRAHHKKIVNCWLNVLKRVKVEQRLVLFYLANDVIQYSKRRKYEYVESWGIALQKATTMVRDDRVKHKILRIFKIWEQRNVYNEEFIADLCGLINVSPATKNDEPHEFQANHVVKKIRYCSSLEADTDQKLKMLREHNPKIQIETDLCASLKGMYDILSYVDMSKAKRHRAHVDDVEKEIDVYVSHMEDYVNALKLEIKNRINLISVLRQAETQLETDKKDVKVVANAYRTFAVRVKTFQKKLDEHKVTLVSPIPSPDIDAPSPSPDSDIDLPDEDTEQDSVKNIDTFADYSQTVQFTNAGYYNPVPAPATETSSSFVTNGYTSFIGGSIPFNIQNFDADTIFNNSQSGTANTQTTNSDPSLDKALSTTLSSLDQGTSIPLDEMNSNTPTSPYRYRNEHLPLLPPPMPPFSTKSDPNYGNAYTYTSAPTTDYGTTSYDSTTYQNSDNNYPSAFPSQTPENFELNNYSSSSAYEAPPGANPYPPSDEYNPEQELDTWESDAAWTQPPPAETDTPESPPMFEKEGYGDPIEYHDNIHESGVEDIDQRVIPIIPIESDDSLGRGQDVDHRNLISLTGSPADSNSNLATTDGWSGQTDQDYRNPPTAANLDQDYRLPPFNIEQLKLPPPPPPPQNSLLNPIQTITTITTSSVDSDPPKMDDIVESIDMDLSDDENLLNDLQKTDATNLTVVVDNVDDSQDELLQLAAAGDSSQDGSRTSQLALEPPPPFPDLPDDEDANNFLDELDNDLNSNEFSANLGDEFPDITKEDLIQDSIFESMENMQLPNLPSFQLPTPPVLPNLVGSPGLPPPNLQNVPSMPPPPPMMSMPPLDWLGDQPPMNTQPPSPNFQPRGGNKGFHRGNGNFRGNFSNGRGNFNNQPNFMNNQPPNFMNNAPNFMNNAGNFNNNRGNFQNNRGNYNNNHRGMWDHRGRGRGRGFRGNRGRGNFRGNFRGGF